LRIGPPLFHSCPEALPCRFDHCDDAFGPEDIAPMSAAFEAALGKLGLADRNDPAITMAIAKLIIQFAKVGERDPERLCALALQQLSK
jgi:hypothetical protein